MKIARIKETCIYVTDLERTNEFYSGKLGLQVIAIVEGRHIFFRAGESALLCFMAEETLQEKELPPHGAVGIIHFAFEVTREEYEPSIKKIEEAGIPIIHHHVWKDGVRSFYFYDPDHNVVEILEEGLWG